MTVSLAGFQIFIQTTMGISSTVLAPTDPQVNFAYDYAIYVVPDILQQIPPGGQTSGAISSLYDVAVYNLGGHTLIEFGVDNPSSSNPTFFQTLQNKFDLNGFNAGMIVSASDETTSDSFQMAKWVENLTIDQLQLLKTPWGRLALSLIQRGSTGWGIS